MSMKVERSTVDQVKAKLENLGKRKAEEQPELGKFVLSLCVCYKTC